MEAVDIAVMGVSNQAVGFIKRSYETPQIMDPESVATPVSVNFTGQNAFVRIM